MNIFDLPFESHFVIQGLFSKFYQHLVSKSSMSQDYTIACKLCGRVHTPIWGERNSLISGFKQPETIKVPYTCPTNGKKGDATFAFSPEIYDRSIIGWKSA